jgi:multiple sugar transport system ATP-binding protein
MVLRGAAGTSPVDTRRYPIAAIALREVSLRLGETSILDRVSLDVADGELIAIIGPSGSGKTSILRVIAGLDSVSSGAVLMDGVDVRGTRTSDRNVAMVFQEAVLYPFLRARDNIGFPLDMRDVSREEIRQRVQAEGRALQIEEILERWPRQLSAGHQQLVQVAKAMIRIPSVLLLDEPLARVDAGLRSRLRLDLQVLQRGYGVTTVYVTNDPVEAMAVGDRLAVIEAGRVRQVGAPLDVYAAPVTRFVAEFVSERPMRFLAGRVEGDATGSWVAGTGFRLRAWAPQLAEHVGREVTVGVRSEDVELASGEGIAATVERAVPLGEHVECELRLGDGTVWMRSAGGVPRPGARVLVRFRRWHVFTADGTAIAHVD